MKRLLLFVLVLSASLSLGAQQLVPLSLALTQKINQLPADAKLGLLVQGDPQQIAKATAVCGGVFRYNNGSICSVLLPVSEIQHFRTFAGITRIDAGPQHLQPLNDTMRIVNRVAPVHAGQAPLPQAYDGTGVIVGIIDSGVDFLHPDLQDSAGKTRILKLWDQNAAGNAPAPYNYGYEWTKGAIDSGFCTHNDLTYYGHGTGVCGIAAGDGSSTTARDYSGVAPKSDMIVVALDFNGVNSATAVADAADYIFTQAQALGRPCVINASVGDYLGSHDGQDLQAQMIDNLLTAQSGRVLVGAVGNAGNLPIHFGYSLTSDTTFTWFEPAQANFLIQVWADTNNFNNAKAAMGFTTHTPSYSDRGRTPFSTVAQNLNTMLADTVYNANMQRLGIVQHTVTIEGGAYLFEFLVNADSTANGYWSLNFTGSGSFHCWSFDLTNPVPPSSAAYPRIAQYHAPDTTYTMVSSFQCSDHVITVGNYVNRSRWINVNGQTTDDTTVTAGAIMWNSSVGPTRDNRVKPDITASGANILTCGVLSMLPGIIAGAPQAVGIGGFHVQSGGSSASSPVVAGAAALYLERFPTANHLDVKLAVTNCAYTDTFTGTNLPNYTWGHGKVDAFSMLTNCMLTVPTTTAATEELTAFPNPADDYLQISFATATAPSTIRLVNVLGEIVWTGTIAPGENSVNLSLTTLAPGVYAVIRETPGSSKQTVRVVVR